MQSVSGVRTLSTLGGGGPNFVVNMYSFFLTTQLESDNQKKKNHDLVLKLAAYTLTQSFSHASHQFGHDSSSPIAVYTVTGGLQYCDHLRPAPEGSVQWCARQATSMCMCMSPRARWMIVHRSYLSMVLSVSVMQAGVTFVVEMLRAESVCKKLQFLEQNTETLTLTKGHA